MNKLLTLTTFLPLLGAVMVLAGGRGLKDDGARWLALGVSLATFIVSLVVLGRFDPSARAPFQMVEQARWVESIGLTYTLGVDGVSIWMILLTTFLFPVSILASWTITVDVRRFMAAMLALETAVIGTFVALDLLLFFLFFEALLVPMYLLIGGWGGRRRVYAAIKFFLFTMAGLGVPAGRDPVPVLEGRLRRASGTTRCSASPTGCRRPRPDGCSSRSSSRSP